MTSTIEQSATQTGAAPSLSALLGFLSRYSARLLGAGATSIRLEKNVGRIAAAYGKVVDISIMPRHVHIALREPGAVESVSSIATVGHGPISFNINASLSQLSWAIADGKVSFEEAEREYRRIISSDHQSRLFVTLVAAAANASFCRLFGGDFIAMGIVAMATLAGYYLKILLLERHTDLRVVVMVCAFVSTVLGATDSLFALGTTPDIAVGTSVLYLVPGIPFLNSFSDMLYRHYLCAISRFIDAVVITSCISLGLCGGLFLMNLGMF